MEEEPRRGEPRLAPGVMRKQRRTEQNRDKNKHTFKMYENRT